MRRNYEEESDEDCTPTPQITQTQQDVIFAADVELIKAKTDSHKAFQRLLDAIVSLLGVAETKLQKD